LVFNHLPVEPLRVTSPFGPRNTGIKGASTFHKGIDLGRDFNKAETDILSVADGVVINNYWNDYRGWVVIIQHNGFQTLSQHLKAQSSLKKGEKVKVGQQIGIMGNSSNKAKLSVAVHLHFELIVNGVQIDPLPYLKNIKEVEDLTREETIALIKEVLAGNGDTPSTWAKDTWDKAKKDDITDGTKPQGYATKEQVIAIVERANKG